ncbi:uncharacterized protein N7482_003732 [Penicillium canariense]|uniref:Uncharacterized protein n=1 Tax=Penicillium canariense TaxID=189055 RepID=A0A9W9I7A5_9EURO|nr:uncharacterized protein N7482_003732 [Penicillium canariense]KAJ5168138.1 hypothetical protein N7482_003732 [Penicillium canariense]
MPAGKWTSGIRMAGDADVQTWFGQCGAVITGSPGARQTATGPVAALVILDSWCLVWSGLAN